MKTILIVLCILTLGTNRGLSADASAKIVPGMKIEEVRTKLESVKLKRIHPALDVVTNPSEIVDAFDLDSHLMLRIYYNKSDGLVKSMMICFFPANRANKMGDVVKETFSIEVHENGDYVIGVYKKSPERRVGSERGVIPVSGE